MNFTQEVGWYYRSINNRAAAWTGVEFFYRFLVGNRESFIGNGDGPFAEETDIRGLQVGDFIQLGRETGDYYHTPVVVGFSNGVPLVAAHTYDAFGRLLTSYRFERVRYLHVLGARKE